MTGAWRQLLIASLLGVHAVLAGWMAYRNSPSGDEPAHIAAGISYWQYGTFSLYNVNPPLVKLIAAAPVMIYRPETDWAPAYRRTSRPEFGSGSRFIASNGQRAFWYHTLARWACIPLSLIGGYTCFRWAGALYGENAGLAALALWCLSPNVLAWSASVTSDLSAAAIGVLAGYCFWRWLKVPSAKNMLIAGLAFGIVQLTKMTWIVLFALWPLLWLFWEWSNRKSAQSGTRWTRAGQLALILFIGLDVLNLGYLCEGTFKPLKDYQFLSKTLAGEESPLVGGDGGNRFAGTWLGELPVPFPENYIAGIDRQRFAFEHESWSFLGGQWQQGGWWYYYIYAGGVKVPLGTWLLALLTLGATLWSFSRRRSQSNVRGKGEEPQLYSAGWRNESVLLLPAVVVFVLVSSQTGLTHHSRYVLPCLPFALIWISKTARSIQLGHKNLAVIAGAALLWTIGSSMWVYPHSLSYFNELAGGPRGGHYHLLDSNIDWGQDLRRLKEWHDAHPEARPLMFDVSCAHDRNHYGLDYPLPPTGPDPAKISQYTAADYRELGPKPGWFAVSVNELHNRHGGYDYFLEHFEPVETIGYSIYIYHITPDEANRVRRELGLPPWEAE